MITLVMETKQQAQVAAQRTGTYRTKTTLARDLRRDVTQYMKYETALAQLSKQMRKSFRSKKYQDVQERRHITERGQLA